MDNLDDFLNVPAPQEEPKAEAVEAPQPEAAEEKPERDEGRDDKGRFKAKGETDAPPASQDEHVPVAAIKDERRKRQELEARLAEYEQKLQQLTNPPQPAPDMYEDPDGWQGHFKGQVKGEAVDEATFHSRLATSEMLAAQAFDDFGEVWEPMNQFINENPAIRQAALKDRHPWAYAYKAFKNNQRASELGATDVTALEAKLREQIKAEMEAERAKPVDIPDSLANAQSGKASQADPSAPPTFDQILGRSS